MPIPSQTPQSPQRATSQTVAQPATVNTNNTVTTQPVTMGQNMPVIPPSTSTPTQQPQPSQQAVNPPLQPIQPTQNTELDEAKLSPFLLIYAIAANVYAEAFLGTVQNLLNHPTGNGLFKLEAASESLNLSRDEIKTELSSSNAIATNIDTFVSSMKAVNEPEDEIAHNVQILDMDEL